MATTSHIYNPKDDSLEARIQAYKTVLSEYRNIQASQKLFKEKAWEERLGSSDELDSASDVIRNSLEVIAKSITKSELEQAVDENILTPNEYREFHDVSAEAKGKQSEYSEQVQKNRDLLNQLSDGEKSKNKNKDLSKDR